MKKNKLLLPILAAVLALVVIAGVILVPRLPKDEVAVFPVSMVGYTDFYSGSSESYGMVTTDKVQTLYVSGLVACYFIFTTLWQINLNA